LFIFLFLYFFKPFGISFLKSSLQPLFTLGFGVITAAVLAVFRFLIEPFVIRRRWTLGKNILWVLLISACIGAANYFYMIMIFRYDFHFLYLLYSIWTAILVGSIPVTIIHILAYNRMYREALKKADVPENIMIAEKEIMITAGNDKNELSVNPGEIIYLNSNDNYVTIAMQRGNNISKVTIRGTLKSAEYELRKDSRFLRCHKCYIVNLDFVDKVEGHSQNMKIRLLNSGEIIPVSRSKAAMLSGK
jgi:hypothetical protein